MSVCAPRAGGVGGLGWGSVLMEVCRRYNEMRCTLQWCSYRHVYVTCGGPHPVKQCHGDTRPSQGSQQGQKRPRYRRKPIAVFITKCHLHVHVIFGNG